MTTPTQPAASHLGQYLCYAWGESDRPVAAIVRDREGVRQFIIDQWLGDEDATDYDGTPTLPGLMEEFDAPEWDMDDSLEWTFEIGGVRITKVFDVSPSSSPTVASPDIDALALEAKRTAKEYGLLCVTDEAVFAAIDALAQAARQARSKSQALHDGPADYSDEWPLSQRLRAFIAPEARHGKTTLETCLDEAADALSAPAEPDRMRNVHRAAKAVAAHHAEFGIECGFGETMDYLFAALTLVDMDSAEPMNAPATQWQSAPGATLQHDAGAIAQCHYCKRSSLDPATLSDRQPKCECGWRHGWSGSFQAPGPDAQWCGARPLPAPPERTGI